jgi:hypothetical protein
MKQSLNVIALVRDTHADTFIFLYDKESVPHLYDHLETLANDKELNLTIQDVVVVCRKIKELEFVNSLNFE